MRSRHAWIGLALLGFLDKERVWKNKVVWSSVSKEVMATKMMDEDNLPNSGFIRALLTTRCTPIRVLDGSLKALKFLRRI